MKVRGGATATLQGVEGISLDVDLFPLPSLLGFEAIHLKVTDNIGGLYHTAPSCPSSRHDENQDTIWRCIKLEMRSLLLEPLGVYLSND